MSITDVNQGKAPHSVDTGLIPDQQEYIWCYRVVTGSLFEDLHLSYSFDWGWQCGVGANLEHKGMVFALSMMDARCSGWWMLTSDCLDQTFLMKQGGFSNQMHPFFFFFFVNLIYCAKTGVHVTHTKRCLVLGTRQRGSCYCSKSCWGSGGWSPSGFVCKGKGVLDNYSR